MTWFGLDARSYVQCRHLILALNVGAARAWYTTAHPIATHFPGHECTDDLTTERGFDTQATWVIDVLGFIFWYTIQWCLDNQERADVRSTGAGIKCLYCRGRSASPLGDRGTPPTLRYVEERHLSYGNFNIEHWYLQASSRRCHA